MKSSLYLLLIVSLSISPCFAKVTLKSQTHIYELRTMAGLDHDSLISAGTSAFCDSQSIVSAYSSDFCWSPGTGDPIDSAWALLYGNQHSCVTTAPGSETLRDISSSTNITGGVIFPGCDEGNPLDYCAEAHAVVKFVFEITNSSSDYGLSYGLLAEDWGGEIMGGNTMMSGYFRLSKSSGQVILQDTLFLGVETGNVFSSGTLQPGTYEIAYAINHTHNGTESMPWFPNGLSSISFDLNLGSIACGDTDASGQIDVTDAVYLINYIFAGGQPPQDSLGGDVDCNNQTDVTDAVYMVNFIFANGPAPCAACQ